MNTRLRNKLKKIKLLILDVDGILTNGEIILDERGREIKMFNVRDGYGIVLFQKAGYKTAVLSARSSAAVTARAKDLNITSVYQNARPKIDVYTHLLRAWKMNDAHACYMGDDLPDMAILKRVGFSATVPNASPEVKACVDYITKHEGGRGAVREVIELILKIQKRWPTILKTCGA